MEKLYFKPGFHWCISISKSRCSNMSIISAFCLENFLSKGGTYQHYTVSVHVALCNPNSYEQVKTNLNLSHTSTNFAKFCKDDFPEVSESVVRLTKHPHCSKRSPRVKTKAIELTH